MSLKRIDHLVYGTTDLEKSVDELEQLLGVRAALGGSHPGWGTKNYLLSLGDETYLEIIGPDEGQETMPTLFGLDEITAPKLITWAAKEDILEDRIAALNKEAIPFGEILSGSRKKTDGSILSWRLTNPFVVHGDRVVPFLIEWGTTPSPAKSCPAGCTLLELKIEHPNVLEVSKLLKALDLDIGVTKSDKPGLIAELQTPKGKLILK